MVRSFVATPSIDSAGLATDSTDTAALEEDILGKLKYQGPKQPRELQRCFHFLRAQDRDKAAARLKLAGRVVETVVDGWQQRLEPLFC
jgi:hypothetical protein|uniref:hypothetical protein n=1 Tax=Prosthecobacter sp. TaxID=1965333 RepID=UPI003783B33C